MVEATPGTMEGTEGEADIDMGAETGADADADTALSVVLFCSDENILSKASKSRATS